MNYFSGGYTVRDAEIQSDKLVPRNPHEIPQCTARRDDACVHRLVFDGQAYEFHPALGEKTRERHEHSF